MPMMYARVRCDICKLQTMGMGKVAHNTSVPMLKPFKRQFQFDISNRMPRTGVCQGKVLEKMY